MSQVHSVLRVVWEPLSEDEPRLWLLAPYAQGILFPPLSTNFHHPHPFLHIRLFSLLFPLLHLIRKLYYLRRLSWSFSGHD